VSDGWSMEILIREIGALYQAYLLGQESPLSELPIQYADYAKWQRQYLTDKVLEKHLAYWKKQLSGPLPALDLPAAHARPLVPSYRGANKSFSLSAELSAALKSLSRQEGVTLYMTLLAAFKTLLYGYTAQEDIIIGTPVANRNRAEIEPLIGFFINMLPMRTDLSGNPRFRELLKQVKDVVLDGYAHQDLPFEELIKEIRPERSTMEMPLFNVVLGVQNIRGEDLKLGDLEVKPMIMESKVARLDLSLLVTAGLKKTQFLWVYRKDLFEEEAVIRMHGHFEALLFNIVDRPDARLTALNVLSMGEIGLSNKEQGDREESDLRKLRSIKRKTVIVSSEAD
jgi:Condensation domain